MYALANPQKKSTSLLGLVPAIILIRKWVGEINGLTYCVTVSTMESTHNKVSDLSREQKNWEKVGGGELMQAVRTFVKTLE
jgi:hypothetical protein